MLVSKRLKQIIIEMQNANTQAQAKLIGAALIIFHSFSSLATNHAMVHEPRGFLGNPQHPVQLMGGQGFFA